MKRDKAVNESVISDLECVASDKAEMPEDSLFDMFRAEFMLDEISAREIYDWFAERLGAGNVRHDSTQRRLALIRHLNYFYRKPTRLTAFALCFAPGVAELDDVIEHQTMSGFARKYGVSKEMVRKEVAAVQTYFGYSPREDQRNGHSKARMSESRRQQLI